MFVRLNEVENDELISSSFKCLLPLIKNNNNNNDISLLDLRIGEKYPIRILIIIIL